LFKLLQGFDGGRLVESCRFPIILQSFVHILASRSSAKVILESDPEDTTGMMIAGRFLEVFKRLARRGDGRTINATTSMVARIGDFELSRGMIMIGSLLQILESQRLVFGSTTAEEVA
jgi:hypothetical protein